MSLYLKALIVGCLGDNTCIDKIPDCAEYTSQACDPPFVTWSQQNCPAFCGFCGKSLYQIESIILTAF